MTSPTAENKSQSSLEDEHRTESNLFWGLRFMLIQFTQQIFAGLLTILHVFKLSQISSIEPPSTPANVDEGDQSVTTIDTTRVPSPEPSLTSPPTPPEPTTKNSQTQPETKETTSNRIIHVIDMPVATQTGTSYPGGIKAYYQAKIEAAELTINERTQNLRRLEAQRNALNARVRLLREELQLLMEPGSYVGEVVKAMGKTKVLVKVQPEGKYIVDIDPEIDVNKLTPNLRVALRSDNYLLHKILPNKVDPLVSLMMVEKVPDSTYEMVGGLDKQIKEIKEVIELPVKHPELFESLGIAQPKGVLLYGPPGTGKTLLARAVAHHTDCRFIRVSGSELVQKYIGEGSRMVRELFVMAREHAPSIIFMDEIDSIGSSRGEGGGSNGDSEVQRTMLELLNQLDGFEATKNIKVNIQNCHTVCRLKSCS
ncbi:15478_t:CDS:2 [Acaulospora colombiana]|uniref:15478_t:CDS:1 n=1 Tax=Acaulospora colombiana TaxID=27376 RepID=A0ACA9N4E9_9GLOM|nr:15478_t:CDS:2 [Acaulospora colombiana]